MQDGQDESYDDGWERIVITNQEQAWEVFQAAVNGEKLPERLILKFKGWPNFEMKVVGRDWNSTVPTRVMSPLLEIQKDINRKYVEIAYGSANLKKLRNEDRDQLEILVEVSKGSSDYKAPLDEQLNVLAKKALERMESRDIVIALVGVALVWGGVEISKAWIAARQQAVSAEVTVQLSKQETERLKVFERAVRQSPVLGSARQDFEESQNRLLKALKPNDSTELKGVALSGSDAMEITHQERARAEDTDITGVFRVLANDASKGNDFRIKIARLADGLTLNAVVPMELDHAQKLLIQKAEWSKGAFLVQIDLTAKLLRGSITEAQVYRVSEVPDADG